MTGTEWLGIALVVGATGSTLYAAVRSAREAKAMRGVPQDERNAVAPEAKPALGWRSLMGTIGTTTAIAVLIAFGFYGIIKPFGGMDFVVGCLLFVTGIVAYFPVVYIRKTNRILRVLEAIEKNTRI